MGVILAEFGDLFQFVADYRELALDEDLILLCLDLAGFCIVQFVDVGAQVANNGPAIVGELQ